MVDAYPKFIGRESELEDLKRFLRKKTASMIVLRGRRRIGKSRLIEEFAKGMTLYSFAGLAPNKQTTAQMQRDIFAKQLQASTGLPVLKTDDWMDLFTLLHERIKSGRIILLFDEIACSGVLTEYLQELVLVGFVKREHIWDFKTGNDSKFSKYRLTDNYVRFYLRYIEKNKNKIEKNMFSDKSVADLPEWRTIVSLQFENLVLNNRKYIFEALHLSAHEIINDNSFFQHATTKQRGCQIDYLIQTKHNTLYVCEIKFSKNPIGVEIIEQLKQKILRLTRLKGISCRPVLIHVNGVSDVVVETGYFSNIIDMSKFL